MDPVNDMSMIRKLEGKVGELPMYVNADGNEVSLTEENLEKDAQTITKRLTLRAPLTGLSKVQARMVNHITLGLTENEVIGACKMHFDLPMRILREQYAELTTGPFPLTRYHTLEALPHVLVSIVDPKLVVNAIEAKINRGRHEFMLPGDVGWNPEFEGGVHLSPDAYLSLWLEETLKKYVDKRIEIVETRKLDVVKRKFIRTICTSQQENNKLVFLGETEREKRRRVCEEFEGRLELLDTPIKEFSMDTVFNEEVRVPESARDMLLEDIHKLII